MNTPNPIHASAVEHERWCAVYAENHKDFLCNCKDLNGSPEAGSPAGVPALEIKVSAEVGHIGPEADDHVVMLSHTDNNPHNFRLWAYPMPKAAADKFALAVNSHDALVAALQGFLDWENGRGHFDDCARAARLALSQSTPNYQERD